MRIVVSLLFVTLLLPGASAVYCDGSLYSSDFSSGCDFWSGSNPLSLSRNCCESSYTLGVTSDIDAFMDCWIAAASADAINNGYVDPFAVGSMDVIVEWNLDYDGEAGGPVSCALSTSQMRDKLGCAMSALVGISDPDWSFTDPGKLATVDHMKFAGTYGRYGTVVMLIKIKMENVFSSETLYCEEHVFTARTHSEHPQVFQLTNPIGAGSGIRGDTSAAMVGDTRTFQPWFEFVGHKATWERFFTINPLGEYAEVVSTAAAEMTKSAPGPYQYAAALGERSVTFDIPGTWEIGYTLFAYGWTNGYGTYIYQSEVPRISITVDSPFATCTEVPIANREGYVCQGSAWDGGGWYCTAANRCCEVQQVWDGSFCVDTESCASPGLCPHDPISRPPEYYTHSACVDIGASEACCDQGLQFGVDPFFDYEPYTKGSGFVTICGETILCSCTDDDNFCPSDLGATDCIDINCDPSGCMDCGNGITEGAEQCDNGVNNGVVCSAAYGASCTYCSNSCLLITVNGGFCGDGTTNGPEECDAGANNGVACVPAYGTTCDYCTDTCTIATAMGGYCGDGICQAPFEDAGNCPADCSGGASCGNGIIEGGEACDDGGSNGVLCSPPYGGSCTYCSATCTVITRTGSYCGDGVCNPGFEDPFTCPDDCAGTCGNAVIEGTEQCDGTNIGGVTCADLDVRFAGGSGTPGCSATCTLTEGTCNEPPRILLFTTDMVPSPGILPQDVNFLYEVQDDKNGLTLRFQFGHPSIPDLVMTGLPSPLTSSILPVSMVYQHPQTYTATLTVTDSNGVSTSATTSFTILCNPGTETGAAADQASNCCADTCFFGGACYSSTDGAGEAVCMDGGRWFCDGSFGQPDCGMANSNCRDRDEDAIYSTGGITCETGIIPPPGCPGTGGCWMPQGGVGVAWCEGASRNVSDLSRCDTFGRLDGQFFCGDDPNEYPFVYSRYDGFSNTYMTHYGCLFSDTDSAGNPDCFGMDSFGNYRSYQHNDGGELCTDPWWEDDNNCDGRTSFYDTDCTSTILVSVDWNESDGSITNASFADVWVNVYDAYRDAWYTDFYLGSKRGKADIQGRYVLTDIPIATPGYPHEVWASYMDTVDDFRTVMTPAEDTTYLLLQTRQCNADCTNLFGRCDRYCLGRNGCPSYATLTPGQRAVMDAAHPPGRSLGKRFGELVILDRTDTERYVGIACTNEPQWEPAPAARLDADADNLITYTRIVTIKGVPVRLVVASFD